jgi:sigma-B regulation protein RsbU (phosphoserine phosphatase)
MLNTVFTRVRTSLAHRRDQLTEWLQNSPAQEKAVILGPASESEVIDHLEAIDDTMEKAETGQLGICRICEDEIEPELLEIDYTAEVCLSHLSNEDRSLLEDEIELAQNVQKSLLPHSIPGIQGLEISAFSRPAQFIGGDYFDFVNFQTDMPGLVIADVAGHGVSASLHMASLQALTRAVLPTSLTPVQAVRHIHRLFIHNIQFSTFVTMFVGAFDLHNNMLTYTNAGHNPPLILHKQSDGTVTEQWLKPTGPAIGLIEDPQFSQQMVQLYENDVLVLYTDGVVEAMDSGNALFGTERLARVLKEAYSALPRDVVRVLRADLESYAGQKALTDDTTFVVCRVTQQS